MKWRGKCHQCRTAAPRPGKTTCARCAAYLVDYQRCRQQERKAAGMCVRLTCSSPAAPGRVKCEFHLGCQRTADAKQREKGKTTVDGKPRSIVDMLNDYDAVL